MEDSRMFWDKKITKDEARKVFRDENHPRFIEYAALFLSRMNEPKAVFKEYIDKKTFCRQWRRIKPKMRENKWNDTRIIFWDEVYRVALKHFNKDDLAIPKEHKKAADPDISQIGQKIKKARKAKGWTQAKLAEQTEFSQQTISLVESGYINVSFLTLKKIVDVLGLKISVLSKEKPTHTTFTVTSGGE